MLPKRLERIKNYNFKLGKAISFLFFPTSRVSARVSVDEYVALCLGIKIGLSKIRKRYRISFPDMKAIRERHEGSHSSQARHS